MYDATYIKCLEKANPQRHKVDCLLLRAGSENKDGLNRCEESYWDDGNVLRLDYDDGCIIW